MPDEETLGPVRDGSDAPPASGGIETRRLQAALESQMFGSAAPPVKAGRFVIEERLGEGAMGVVYRARDPDLDRDVAVKILRRGPGDASQTDGTTRLKREARALARLNHPNVVAVLDVGVQGEQLFVAMEYVRGETLAQWCTQKHSPGARVRRAIAFAEEAANGLAAAHGAGVVHRDLKPQNMLVGEDGRLRIADFGLARSETDAESGATPGRRPELATDDPDGLTATGQVVGTPAYMAPEQFEGHFDARSDQFSYCASFWEAVYGSRPFRGETVAELWAAIAQGTITEPEDPTDVPGWFDAILRRGLNPDPDLRFPSMEALLDALHVGRRRRSPGYALAAIGVVALGAVAWVWSDSEPDGPPPCADTAAETTEVWNDARRASLEARFLEASPSRGPASARRVVDALDPYLEGWKASRIAACEDARASPESDATFDVTLRCIDRQLDRVRSLLSALEETPAGELDVDRFSGAIRSLPNAEACAASDSLQAELSLPVEPWRRAMVEAIEAERSNLAARLETTSQGSNRQWAEDVVRRARATDHDPLLARSLVVMGDRQAVDRDPDAIHTFEEAYDTASRAGMHTTAVDAATAAADVLVRFQGKHDDADRFLRQAEALLPRVEPSGGIRTSRIVQARGELLMAEGQYGEAAEILRKQWEVELRRGAQDEFLAVRTSHVLGQALAKLGRYDEALQAYERALVVYRRELGDNHGHVSSLLTSIGLVRSERGDGTGALEAFEEARDIAVELVGREHPLYAQTEANLGYARLLLGDIEGARQAHRNALQVFDAHLPETHPARIIARVNVSQLVDDEEAEPLLREALDLAERHQGADGVQATSARAALGALLRRTGRPQRAVAELEVALQRHEAFGRKRRAITDRAELARALVQLGEVERGRSLAAKALEDAIALYGSGSSKLTTALVAVGLAEEADGDRQAALDHLRQAAELADASAEHNRAGAEARQALTRLETPGSAG